jgi:hypothetical protein
VIRLLRSPRRRRRLAWIGSVLVITGTLAFLGVQFANTGHDYTSPFLPGPVDRPPAAPKPDPFTAVERREVRAVAVQFISTAVYRKNVDASWAISGPALRQGFTRAAWAKGSIPIVPYPEKAIREVRWRLNYSFESRVGLKVAFYPKPGAGIARQVFDIEVSNVGSATKHHWIVSDWTPSGGPQIAAAAPGASQAQFGPRKSEVRPIWLLAPIILIVGSLLGLLAWLGVRRWIRQSRANRAYSNMS